MQRVLVGTIDGRVYFAQKKLIGLRCLGASRNRGTGNERATHTGSFNKFFDSQQPSAAASSAAAAASDQPWMAPLPPLPPASEPSQPAAAPAAQSSGALDAATPAPKAPKPFDPSMAQIMSLTPGMPLQPAAAAPEARGSARQRVYQVAVHVPHRAGAGAGSVPVSIVLVGSEGRSEEVLLDPRQSNSEDDSQARAFRLLLSLADCASCCLLLCHLRTAASEAVGHDQPVSVPRMHARTQLLRPTGPASNLNVTCTYSFPFAYPSCDCCSAG